MLRAAPRVWVPVQGRSQADSMSSILDSSESGSTAIVPEQRLFLGVILNAALEAAGNRWVPGRGHEPERARQLALAWFKEADQDFQTVCSLVGLEADNVRAGVLAYVDKVSDTPADAIKMRRRGKAGPSSRKVTLADVATHAGVSSMTVSRVLEGKLRVTAETRAGVTLAIDTLGYCASTARQGGRSVH